MVNFDRGMQMPANVGQPDLSPENMTVSDYSGEREAKIAELEQQIAMVKERIARNERALTGKSFEDVNNKMASLEMKKINSQDPTMLWRWQNQRQDMLKANENAKSSDAAKFANTVDMWLNTKAAPTTEGIMQQISNINSAIRDGKNVGADVSKLVAKKEELEKLVYGEGDESKVNYGAGTAKEQLAGLLKTTLSTAKTSDELTTFKNEHPDLTSEQLHSVDEKIDELQKKEEAKAKSEKFEKYLKSRGYKNGSKGLSPKILATLKRQYGG